ncbi:MAG: dephospho-CoA kinase [Candidatus Omnitrophota bacterium]
MIIGITGSVGSGKSTVSRLFRKKGAVRFDADRLAREAIEPGRAPYRALVGVFGKGILRENGTVNRRKLAQIVFKNPRRVKILNRLIHPYVIRRMKQEMRGISRRRCKPCIVVEVPLLHEARLAGMFNRVITVSCSSAGQKARWVKRGGRLSDLNERKACQLPLSYKKKHSDFIIDNSGRLQNTKSQVDRIWQAVVCRKERKREEKKWMNKKTSHS